MKYHLFRLIPPRPTFMQDLTATEAALMQAHAAYWQQLMAGGQVVAFGPVADPNGVYGLAIVELADDADPQALGAADPTIRADAGFRFEMHLMPKIVVRP